MPATETQMTTMGELIEKTRLHRRELMARLVEETRRRGKEGTPKTPCNVDEPIVTVVADSKTPPAELVPPSSPMTSPSVDAVTVPSVEQPPPPPPIVVRQPVVIGQPSKPTTTQTRRRTGRKGGKRTPNDIRAPIRQQDGETQNSADSETASGKGEGGRVKGLAGRLGKLGGGATEKRVATRGTTVKENKEHIDHTGEKGTVNIIHRENRTKAALIEADSLQLGGLMKAGHADIRMMQFYHGLLPREDAESLLARQGDYLVRLTDVGGEKRFTLSVMGQHKCTHLLVHIHDDQLWYINHEIAFEALPDLFAHYQTVTNSQAPPVCDNLRLKRPISRALWQLAHDDIELRTKLGEGAFGEVFLGVLRLAKGQEVTVAVKMLSAKSAEFDKESISKFVSEARIMRKFNHANIVRLYGVAVHRLPIYIVMEFCRDGSLKDLITKPDAPPPPLGLLIGYCADAANGMKYLSKKQCIHRDLAARNCLLDNGVAKITDFGLSMEGTKFTVDGKLKQVPIKWLAPETLRSKVFSHETDVWSFGMMLWETFNEGKDPYPGMNNQRVMTGLCNDNYRMTIPKHVCPEIASLMEHCWAEVPEQRPKFDEINRRLKSINKKYPK